jgi:hypothetical protein
MPPKESIEEKRVREIAEEQFYDLLQSRQFTDLIDKIVDRSVKRTLESLGLDMADQKELREIRKDFEYLRDWRLLWRLIKNKGILTVIGMVVAALVIWCVAGFKGSFH